MTTPRLLSAVAAFPLLALVACSASSVTYEQGISGEETDEQMPGLPLGAAAPDATVLDIDGIGQSLANVYQEGPTILIFYRGGWCQFCNQTLADWASQAEHASELGAQIIAISPESPENAGDTSENLEGPITIYSDAYHEAASGFEISQSLGLLDRTGYSLGGIDLDDWNASGEWTLPAGATYVIDRSGVIRYRFADWDHTVRADPADVLRAVQELEAGS